MERLAHVARLTDDELLAHINSARRSVSRSSTTASGYEHLLDFELHTLMRTASKRVPSKRVVVGISEEREDGEPISGHDTCTSDAAPSLSLAGPSEAAARARAATAEAPPVIDAQVAHKSRGASHAVAYELQRHANLQVALETLMQRIDVICQSSSAISTFCNGAPCR
jgi:hypothetical protein